MKDLIINWSKVTWPKTNWYDEPWADYLFGFIERHYRTLLTIQLMAVMCVLAYLLSLTPAWADARLPGQDISSQMESAGTLLRFIDTGIFQWTARVLAGLCIFGAGWSLKEMRFGPAVIAVVAAILFGTAPTWVKNIFSIGGANSVFSQTQPIDGGGVGVTCKQQRAARRA